MNTLSFDQQYYHENELAGDRIALWWYARVVRHLRPRGGRLLDFGCGTGYLLKRLSSDFEAFGYDPAPFARRQSRANAPDAVILDEWESLPGGTFEIIVSLHTLEHLPQPLPILEQLSGKLVPDGILLFVVPNPGGLGHRLKGRDWFAYRDTTHASLLASGEWVALARRAGLEIVWLRGDGLWDAPYVRFVPTVVQRAFFGALSAVQVLSPVGRPFLPPALSECLIVTARKPREAS